MFRSKVQFQNLIKLHKKIDKKNNLKLVDNVVRDRNLAADR